MRGGKGCAQGLLLSFHFATVGRLEYKWAKLIKKKQTLPLQKSIQTQSSVCSLIYAGVLLRWTLLDLSESQLAHRDPRGIQ